MSTNKQNLSTVTVHPVSPYTFAWLPGPVPGAGCPPTLLLPDCLCLDAGGGTASLQYGDKSLRVRGQQAPLLLWDRLGYVVGVGQRAGIGWDVVGVGRMERNGFWWQGGRAGECGAGFGRDGVGLDEDGMGWGHQVWRGIAGDRIGQRGSTFDWIKACLTAY